MTRARVPTGAPRKLPGTQVADREILPTEEDLTEEDLTDTVMVAGGALVMMALRTLAETTEDITLTQYRAMVGVASRGPCRMADLARILGVTPSTATRMCDRLVRKGLAKRSRDSPDRRQVTLSLTDDGEHLVREVVEHRRREIGQMLLGIPLATREHLPASLAALSDAIGEVPERLLVSKLRH